MLNRNVLMAVCIAVVLAGPAFSQTLDSSEQAGIIDPNVVRAAPQTLQSNYNDFLHYLMIGRFDLAKGYAQSIIALNY